MLLQDILAPGKLMFVWLFRYIVTMVYGIRYTYTSNNATGYTFSSTLAPSSSSAQQSSFHSLFGGPSPSAGLTSCSGPGVWVGDKTGKTAVRESQDHHVFPVFQHASTHPTPVLLCRHWLLHGISSENLRRHWSAYMLGMVDAWMILQACKTSNT